VKPWAEHPESRALLETVRRALAACSEGLDAAAVQPETPLAALLFDSLMVLNFIATLEELLGAADLPFEQWLAEHSERTDALTIGSLVGWLRALPRLADAAALGATAAVRAQGSRGTPEDG
jgi:acyl carrier protein